ncbi:MAG: amidohydrolase family protein [Acidobacteriota bacterium]
MPTRREFLLTAGALTAGVSPLARQSGKYDLIIKGGRVLDPGQRLDRVMDVAVRDGRIAAVRSFIDAAGATVLDAHGKLVTPGLVDIHAHVSEEMPPAHCLSTGVTALVDAGSAGADNVAALVDLAKGAPNRVRVLLNLSRTGLGGRAELLDFTNGDVALARRAIEAHRDLIVGIKARLSRSVVGDRDLDAIRRAHEITVPLNLPLMVHIGQTSSTMPAILALLRPGDIVTHVYAPPPNTIFDDSGRLWPEVLAARARGVWFDIGNGRTAHITWDMAERAIGQGFLPDTISSDLTAPGRTDRVFDFPTVLSKFLMLGLSLDQVIACATVNAARAMPPFRALGTLGAGQPADIAVFELRDGEFEFVDNENASRAGRQKLVPFAVVAGGQLIG